MDLIKCGCDLLQVEPKYKKRIEKRIEQLGFDLNLECTLKYDHWLDSTT